jgi:Rho-binding antiterminator
MKTSYRPVSCDFYDELLDLATRKENIKIVVFNSNDTLDSFYGVIHDVYTKNGEEFISIGDFSPVRLDRIITYNGKPGPNFSEYESRGDLCHECKE